MNPVPEPGVTDMIVSWEGSYPRNTSLGTFLLVQIKYSELTLEHLQLSDQKDH